MALRCTLSVYRGHVRAYNNCFPFGRVCKNYGLQEQQRLQSTEAKRSVLTDEQKAQFESEGYVIVKDVFDKEHIQRMKDAIEECEEKAKFMTKSSDYLTLDPHHSLDNPMLQRVHIPSLLFPVFEETIRYESLLDIVADLIGPNIRYIKQDKINLKLPKGTRFPIKWHQDWAFNPHTNQKIVMACVSIDDTTIENGATITSWKCKDNEMLFVSKKAVFDGKKAIRGGIPVVFPNFGPWELGPQHGFARISKWHLDGEPQVENDCAVASFVLEDSELTRQMWNYKFKLIYTVTVGQNKLTLSLAVENKDDKPINFTTLLHTYFRVPNVTMTTVSGFNGLHYIDKIREGQKFTETRDSITIDCLTDRVYENTPNQHVITQADCENDLIIEKTNLPDTVVWNPWQEKAKAMTDFGDNEYPYMICVEGGHVTKPVTLQPGNKFQCGQICTVSCGKKS